VCQTLNLAGHAGDGWINGAGEVIGRETPKILWPFPKPFWGNLRDARVNACSLLPPRP
jgi:hypothetical protein